MGKFSVVLRRLDETPELIPSGLILEPAGKMSFTDFGGPEEAQIEAFGTIEQIGNVLGYLRYGVEIRNENGTPIWWGFINSVDTNVGNIVFSSALDNMYNSVKTKYSYRDPYGNFASGETAWNTDTYSISNFGTKELIQSVGEGTVAGATSAAAVLLEQSRLPMTSIKKASNRDKVVKAMINCKGWIHILDWRYCLINRGLDEYKSDVRRSFLMGFSRTSTTFSFTASSRKIEDLSYDFSKLNANDVITVAGSASNNGTYTIETVSTNSITVEETLVTEAAGPSVTLASKYTKMSQVFQTQSTYEVDRISMYVQKIGAPSGSVFLDITNDSAGAPGGTTLQSASRTAANITTTMSSQEFVFSGYTLALGTTYHLVLRTTATVSDTNFYRIGYDYEDLAMPYGNGKVYASPSWLSPFSFGLPYLIIDKLDTIKQIKAIFDEFGQVFTSSNYPNLSAVKTNQWRDGSSTAFAEVKKLVEIGSSGGATIYIEITPARDITIKINDQTNEVGPAIDQDGRFRYSTGGVGETGVVHVGYPVRLIDMPRVAIERIGKNSVTFERCEFDFDSGSYDWVVKKSKNRFKLATIQQG